VIISGNCSYYLGGGIIAESFSLSGNAASVTIDEKGGFADDGSAGDYTPNPPGVLPPINPEDFKLGADKKINIINMETIRK
jgi:hypothetical protein